MASNLFYKILFLYNIIVIIVKSGFGRVFKQFIYSSRYLQVVWTSTDLDPKFSAPFKAGKSRQVQTCLQYTKYTHKGIQYFNWFVLDRRNGNSNDLETQSVNVKRSPLGAPTFSLSTQTLSSGIPLTL